MSKLDELIKEKCPNGVEYKDLGKVCKIEKGKQLNKEQLSEDGLFPVMNGGINPSGYWNEYNFEENSITISQGGASAGYINFLKTKFWAGAHCYVVKKCNETMNYKFIYHFLKEKQKYLLSSQVGAGIPSISLKEINALRIPIPPIYVQEEIVRILDKFGELETELEAELEAELGARKCQYEFWRAKLFDNDNLRKIRLDELFKLKNGFTPSKSNNDFWTNGTIPWFRMEDIRENGRILNDAIQHVTIEATKGNVMPENSVIVSTSATIGEHALITCDSLANQRFTYLVLKDEYKNIVDMKYIYYHCFLLDEYCLNNLNQGNFASVDGNAFKKYEFSIPSLEVQQKIVNVLDEFDKLVNEILVSLPAEIEARRKQYEYYRNKLLSFEELKNE